MRFPLALLVAGAVVSAWCGAVGAAPLDAHGRGRAAEACEPMVERSVASALDASATVQRSGSWRGSTFTCRYTIGDGVLAVRVHVYGGKASARRAFTRIARQAHPGTPLSGLGQQAFQAEGGQFIARKDRFVIDADPSQLPASQRRDVAFAAGLGLLDCW
jgi:hypothetical protein